MSTQETKRTKTPAQALKGIAREQLVMLIFQFLAGIAVGLIGMPEKTNGFPKIATSVLLGLHVLVAIGLVTGAVRSFRPAAHVGSPAAGLAWSGFAVVLVTFAAGVLTMATGSDWWSYLMAAGATALLVIYGLVYERAIR